MVIDVPNPGCSTLPSTDVTLIHMVVIWSFCAMFVWLLIVAFFLYGSQHRRQSSLEHAVTAWQQRLELCCFGEHKHLMDSKDVMKDVAGELAHLFHDVDWAPTDIAVGLTLLKREQKRIIEVRQARRLILEQPKGFAIPKLDSSETLNELAAATLDSTVLRRSNSPLPPTNPTPLVPPAPPSEPLGVSNANNPAGSPGVDEGGRGLVSFDGNGDSGHHTVDIDDADDTHNVEDNMGGGGGGAGANSAARQDYSDRPRLLSSTKDNLASQSASSDVTAGAMTSRATPPPPPPSSNPTLHPDSSPPPSVAEVEAAVPSIVGPAPGGLDGVAARSKYNPFAFRGRRRLNHRASSVPDQAGLPNRAGSPASTATATNDLPYPRPTALNPDGLNGMLTREEIDDILHFAIYAEMVYDPSDVEAMVSQHVVRVSVINDLFLSPYIVVKDPDTECVIVAVRGTFSAADVLVDLKFDLEEFEIPELVEAGYAEKTYAHSGMLRTARNIVEDIAREEVLSVLLLDERSACYGWPLIVTGHSLGGGVAALVACMLREDYPSASCYAYEPPGCLLSANASTYFESFCTSVIMGDDIVPRVSKNSMEMLKMDVRRLIQSCDVPKWRVFGSVLGTRIFCSCCTDDSKKSDRKGLLHRRTPSGNLSPEALAIIRRRTVSLRHGDASFHLAPPPSEPMFVPGRILYMEKLRRPPLKLNRAIGNAFDRVRKGTARAGARLRDGIVDGAEGFMDAVQGHGRAAERRRMSPAMQELDRPFVIASGGEIAPNGANGAADRPGGLLVPSLPSRQSFEVMKRVMAAAERGGRSPDGDAVVPSPTSASPGGLAPPGSRLRTEEDAAAAVRDRVKGKLKKVELAEESLDPAERARRERTARKEQRRCRRRRKKAMANAGSKSVVKGGMTVNSGGSMPVKRPSGATSEIQITSGIDSSDGDDDDGDSDDEDDDDDDDDEKDSASPRPQTPQSTAFSLAAPTEGRPPSQTATARRPSRPNAVSEGPGDSPSAIRRPSGVSAVGDEVDDWPGITIVIDHAPEDAAPPPRRRVKLPDEEPPRRESDSVEDDDEDARSPVKLSQPRYPPSQVIKRSQSAGQSAAGARAKERVGKGDAGEAGKSGKYHYIPRWAKKEEFAEIVVSRSMVLDHFPFDLMREFQAAPAGSVLGLVTRD
ncbi:hypothetical protein HK101_012058 [Irineochytrium annulatum]|nr:hypothetical protein HK101_012058 [Irineochytrium annulatum]